MPHDKPMDRRRFFRRGLAELIKPIASAISPIERMAHEFGKLEAVAAGQPPAKPLVPVGAGSNRLPLNVWLRPPGAIREKEFRETCSRGGECVKACPAQCIKIDPTGARGHGAPFIDADTQACVVCDGLYCMDVCPSGALVPTAMADIDMGTAVWREETCVRSAGQDCRICVEKCPLGDAAITLKNGEIAVNPIGCIGCGECQHYCPTSPKSISVIPKAAKEA